MQVLPPRPLPLRTGFLLKFGVGAAVCAAGALAIAVWGGQWLWSSAEKIRRDDQIWASGVPTADTSVEGEEKSSHFIHHTYDLKVEYYDAEDVLHKREVSFSSVFREVDQSKPLIVRYDPASPDEFALSWAIELGGARWGSFGVECFGIAAITMTLGFLAWTLRRQVADARLCAESSDEALLQVVSVTDQIVNGRRTGAKIYRYRLPDAATEREIVLASASGSPLFADEEGKMLVALISPRIPNRPMVVRRDLYPFKFTVEQAVEVRERVEAQRSRAFPGGFGDKPA